MSLRESVIMLLNPARLIYLLLLCSSSFACLPVETINNATLYPVHTPLISGNYFEARVVNPANSVTFKIFPTSGISFKYDFTVTVYKGQCTTNVTNEYVIARSKSSSIIRITIPESNAAYYTALVVSNNAAEFEIQFCERGCDDPCLDDCLMRGYCNTSLSECDCFVGWNGENCETRIGGRLVLFGSRLIGILVMIALPSFLGMLSIVCGVACWFQNRRKDRRTAPVVIYQQFPYQSPQNGEGSEDGSESQPLLSQKYY